VTDARTNDGAAAGIFSLDVLHFPGHIGYRLYDLYNFRYDESGLLRWGDAIFLPETVHLRCSGALTR
jgi:hypothetical protein